MREEFTKVQKPHQYKGVLLGVLKIPITVVHTNGDMETSNSWMREHLTHPLELKYPWASDALYEMYNQIEALRFRTPEVLHCFETLGGGIYITQEHVNDYKRHVLGKKDLPKGEDEKRGASGTYGIASIQKDVCIDSRGVFHDINGRGAERTTFIHEIVHVADIEMKDGVPRWGRFSNTNLMKAVLNTEINLNPRGVSASIQKRIQNYDAKDQLHEYLPRLFQQYVEDQKTRDPKDRKLSALENALIEKVFLPDCKLRANGEIGKAGILRTEYDRSFEEMMLGADIKNLAYMKTLLTKNPPKASPMDFTQFQTDKAAKAVREELLAFMDDIPDQAAHYLVKATRRREKGAQSTDQVPA